jgi:hypothetical protein
MARRLFRGNQIKLMRFYANLVLALRALLYQLPTGTTEQAGLLLSGRGHPDPP